MLKKRQQNHCDVAAIVTAMTNAEQPFLGETLTAVLSETGISQVILCVEENNAWIDTALGHLLNDPRLDVIRMPLSPIGWVRNRALSYVRMPWVTYCDGDDTWCSGKTLIQRGYAETFKCDFIGADHCLTDEAGKIRGFALARNIPMPSSWMVRTEIMRQYPFNESLYRGSDGEWWVRTKNIPIYKVRCPKLLVRYRVRSNSLSSSVPSKNRKEKIVFLAKIPGLGAIIFFTTLCLWFLGRQKGYVWQRGWPQYSYREVLDVRI